MDSRIEELAAIIQERAKQTADAISAGVAPFPEKEKDRFRTSRRIESLALELLTELHEFRCRHRDDYA